MAFISKHCSTEKLFQWSSKNLCWYAQYFSLYFSSINSKSKKIFNFNFYSHKPDEAIMKVHKGNKSIVMDFVKTVIAVVKNTWEIIIFKNLLYTLTALIEICIFWNIYRRTNGIIFVLILGNILIFYSPIDKRCPKFLFRIRMFIKEIIEGILVVLSCLIPSGSKQSS